MSDQKSILANNSCESRLELYCKVPWNPNMQPYFVAVPI